jgi:hypothetical protein
MLYLLETVSVLFGILLLIPSLRFLLRRRRDQLTPAGSVPAM